MSVENIVVTEMFNAVERYGLIKVLYKAYGNYAKMNLGFSKKVCATEIISASMEGCEAP